MKPRNIKLNQKDYITFIPTESDIEKDKINSCSLKCPYGIDICTRLKSPINPSETFMDFCSNLSLSFDDPGLEDYCPMEGSLEKLYPNLLDNLFKQEIIKDPYINLGKIIDVACKDTCPLYKEDHSNCTRKNEFCLFRNLIKLRKNE